ncbi:MAG: organic solvent ABC transporter ATP-binding protein [Alphaproteobacteria bacterium]|nr:organic solvent ABC transporter ATP-binding protein [Alphaproteobacteria bacterium]
MPALVSIAGQPDVLAFDAARLRLEPDMPPTAPMTLSLAPRSLAIVDAVDPVRAACFADLAVGLAAPEDGQVRFLGRDWAALDPDTANAMRGRIGRLVGDGAWIDYLSVLDNILLPQLHHTTRREEPIKNDAARLARLFGLPGIPLAHPSSLDEDDLHRAALVRAFLGRPQLVVLERATQRLYPEIMEPLINAIRYARDRGAAVLWLSLDQRIWGDPSLPATARLRLIGGRLVEGYRAA